MLVLAIKFGIIHINRLIWGVGRWISEGKKGIKKSNLVIEEKWYVGVINIKINGKI